MSAIGDCCPPCPPFTPPVNIPGSPGEPGIPGVNGVNAFSTMASSFVVPGVGNSQQVFITDTGEWMALNQPVYVSGAGQYTVTAVASVSGGGTSVQLKNVGAAGNAIPGSVISLGNTISPSGLQGVNSFTTTTASFTWGAFNTSSTLTCANVSWMVYNASFSQIIFIAGAGFFQVAGPPNVVNGTVSVTNLQYAGNTSGGTIGSGVGVSPAGVQGSLPLPLSTPFYSASLNVALTNTMTNIGTAQVTLLGAGTWLVFSRFVINYLNTSNAVQPQVSAQLQVVSGSGSFTSGMLTNPFLSFCNTSGIEIGGSISLPPALYQTASVNDVLGFYADYLTNTVGGSIFVKEVSIVALCINLTT